MQPVLDIVALRSYVAIADHSGFHRAAEALHLSQSAISQHVRRLEKVVGGPLVTREGRGMRFTQDGQVLLEEARAILAAHDSALARLAADDEPLQIVVGSTEHSADLILPQVRVALRDAYPGCEVRFRIDRGARLHDGLADGSVDVAVFLGQGDRPDRIPAGGLPLAWYSAPGWRQPEGQLPVIAIDEPCTIRRRALSALADAQIPSAVVCDSGHLAGVVNAARAGLGVALLAHIGEAPSGLQECVDLPWMPAEPLHVCAAGGVDADVPRVVAEAITTLLDSSTSVMSVA